MESRVNRTRVRRRIRYRIRKKVSGTSARPRLAVYRSLKNIYVQAIDDEHGRTLAQASSLDKELRGSNSPGGNLAAAGQVGELIAKKLKDAGVERVVFDRGGFLFHGRIKALADAAREHGLKF
jgi:large subunit ribosomal protein L18